MAKKYLKGSDVESDPTRYKARLYAIANELYIMKMEFNGGTFNSGITTQRELDIIQKKVQTGTDENEEPVYQYYDEYALPVETTDKTYDFMIQIHKDLLVDTLTGWDLT